MTQLQEEIGSELAALREAGTYKRFNTLESPQGPGGAGWRAAAR